MMGNTFSSSPNLTIKTQEMSSQGIFYFNLIGWASNIRVGLFENITYKLCDMSKKLVLLGKHDMIKTPVVIYRLASDGYSLTLTNTNSKHI